MTDHELMALFRERAGSCGLYLDADKRPDPYTGAWQAICAWEQEQNPDGLPTPLRAKIHEIAGNVPDPMAAFAVNTTRVGRPLDEVTPGLDDLGDKG